jgi:two-component system, NtrC family, nitrogen regulation sensor histidine kinase NtrY
MRRQPFVVGRWLFVRLIEPNPIREAPKTSGRRKAVIGLAIGAFLLLAALVLQASFNLKFISPDSNQELLFFAGLSGLIFFAFVALTVVLGRNLLKLYAERRQGVAGSKFRTRLVVVSLLLSFLPVIAMFWFSYGLMNRSIDKWFSQPVEEVRADTAAMSALLYDYAGQNATSEAQSISQSEEFRRAFASENFAQANEELREHIPTLQGGFVLALANGNASASVNSPAPWINMRSSFPLQSALLGEHPHFQWGQIDYIVAATPLENGSVIVAMPLPPKFAQTVKQIQESQRRYIELAAKRKLFRRTYIGYLLLLTVVVLFASTWLALLLSKLVNRPVAALAAGTEAISKGQLDYRVDIRATDELAELVHSFNSMAEQLESSRHQIETSSRDVGTANEALERRRRYIETVLESIPTGVISIDAFRRVTLANAAFSRMFYIDRNEYIGPAALVNLPLHEVIPADVLADLEPLLRRADRMGITAANIELDLPRAQLNVAVTVSALRHASEGLGYVLVFEDLSDLLRAQKQAAWREVARRVAHEIKNPLTPIALSAERIHRHLTRGTPPDAASLEVIRTCAETIGKAVETVRTLVDEFSVLARFPASRPQPASLNDLVASALAMFDGRLDGIRVSTELAKDLPAVMADPEAIKRAIANLVDNAAEAMQNATLKEITISTALVGSRDAVELVVSDTGQGVSRDVKERLFLPYFSTKQRGTGLGLAIVSRIVEDHRGSIRVEENKPVGSRFVIELPVAADASSNTIDKTADAAIGNTTVNTTANR